MAVKVALLGIVLACYVWQDASYIPVWRANLTLWAHAATMAPLKPRPAMNYGVELIKAGRMADGSAQLSRASALANQSHVAPWDRQATLDALTLNIRALVVRVMAGTK